jgi:hypothetical protein
LVWLNTGCTTESVVDMLETQSPSTNNIAGIGEIFWGAGITPTLQRAWAAAKR